MKKEQVKNLYELVALNKDGTREGRFERFLEAVKIVDEQAYHKLSIRTHVDYDTFHTDNVAHWEKMNEQDKPEDRVHKNIYQQLKTDKKHYKLDGKKAVDFYLVYDKEFVGILEL